MPKWKNIVTIVNTVWLPVALLTIFYVYIILCFVLCLWERRFILDIYQMMMVGLQMIMYLATSVNIQGTMHRIIIIIAYHGTTLFYITFTSFYILIINADISYPQINSISELMQINFQLTTDSYTMELMDQNQMVCTFDKFVSLNIGCF